MGNAYGAGPVIVLHEEKISDLLAAVVADGAHATCTVRTLDNEDVFVVGAEGKDVAFICRAGSPAPGVPKDAKILITASPGSGTQSPATIHSTSGEPYSVWPYLVRSGQVTPAPAIVVPRDADVFDRVRGVFESDVLRDSHVCILGVGSGGSFIARELAKSGVGRFTLVDSDRLEIGNVCRHECGIRDIGRLKTHAVAELLRNHSPAVSVTTAEIHISGATLDPLREIVRSADLVICGTDNRESRLIVNRLALQEGKTAIYAGAQLRAVSGQVLRVIPEVTPCYQCFVTQVPGEASNNEISSATDAARVAYSDRPMPIEPGLSSDVIPIALHVVKLALVELLRKQNTSLASLREDLIAPWYFWVNRRDPRTEYANWGPLIDNMEGMRILRWYGVLLERHKGCAACDADANATTAEVAFFGA